MLRPKPSHIEHNHNGSNPPSQEFSNGVSYEESTRYAEGVTAKAVSPNVDIQSELTRLEDMILSGLHIPLTRHTLVDEERLLDLLDFIRASLPSAFAEAAEIIQQREEILLQAEEYGQQVVEAAQAKRAQILDESDIIKQAEREASELRRQVQQECEEMLQSTLEDIDRQRRQCQQEVEEMRREAIAEAEAIQQGADDYADSVLENIEAQLHEMMQIVSNGRQQLLPEFPRLRSSQSPKKK